MESIGPAPTSSANTVTDNGDYIDVAIKGPQDAQTIEKINLEAAALAENFKSQNKPVLLLVSMADMNTVPNLGVYGLEPFGF